MEKKAVRLNALSHGLRAEEQILPGESRADFERLEGQFLGQFQPRSELECFLLGQMVNCAWRLRRVAQVETGIFVHYQEEIANPPARIVGLAGVSGHDYALLGGDESWSEAPPPEPVKAAAPAEQAALGEAFLRASLEVDAFTKICRYEATIRAGFYRAYEELQHLRAARGAEEPAQPAAAGQG